MAGNWMHGKEDCRDRSHGRSTNRGLWEKPTVSKRGWGALGGVLGKDPLGNLKTSWRNL